MTESSGSGEAIYADLHFHTHYSDNRDRATVEEMVRRGLACGISIFGTGDHNHNLTAERFQAQVAESAAVRSSLPGVVLMNNCEMTFLLGHFLVFDPGRISGTVEEAYGYLYGSSREQLLMANHPGLPSDEWNARINQSIGAVEVVNGAVIREGRRRGEHARSLLELPAVGTFVSYLRLGIPVAAVGSSDAHALDELGGGFTGFHFDGRPDVGRVLASIRERRSFATTHRGIDLRWSAAGSSLDWQVALVAWEGEASGGSGGGLPAFLELYNGGALVERQTLREAVAQGSFRIAAAGLYWIAVLCGEDFAISSPVAFGPAVLAADGPDRDLATRAERIARFEKRTLSLGARELLATRSPAAAVPIELRLFSTTAAPLLFDARSRRLGVRLVAREEGRTIVDKECEPWQFEEFYIWLERNEIHEYRFASIAYRLDREIFFFSGLLIPFRCDKRADAAALFRKEVTAIRTLVDRASLVHAAVKLPAVNVLEIESAGVDFPITVSPAVEGTASVVAEVEVDGESAGPAVEQFFVSRKTLSPRPASPI